MNSNSVNLIATDPPFNKSKDFHATPDSLAAGASFQDRWSWIEDVHDEWLTEIMRDHPEVWSVITTAKQTYGDDMGAFLCWLGVRLLEMHRVLRDDGSLYLHCDDTATHYIKALLDAIFGASGYRNHLVWRRATSHNDAKNFGRILDHILCYGKTDDVYWDGKAIAEPKSEAELKKAFPQTDSRGPVRFSDLTGPRHNTAAGNPSTLPWKGYDVYSRGRVWSVPKTGEYARYIEEHFIPNYRSIEGIHDRLDALNTAGLIHHPDKGVWPGLKRYAASDQGTPPQNLILSPMGFTNFNKAQGEYVGYPTQKPIGLYERLILASCPPKGIVLDPFAGCATTPVAAERLGRQWVAIDIWDGAIDVVRQRMEDNRQLLGDIPVIRYKTTPPERTDNAEPAVLELQTPRSRQRYPRPRSQHGRLIIDIGAYCQGCGRDYGFDPRVLEVDHIRPKADGGSDAYDNLTLLCPPCNREKRDRYTLSHLQDINRREGHLAPENERNIRHGKAPRRRRRRGR